MGPDEGGGAGAPLRGGDGLQQRKHACWRALGDTRSACCLLMPPSATHPRVQVGMGLTESMAMLPAAAVSGLYFASPASSYFAVGEYGHFAGGGALPALGTNHPGMRAAPFMPSLWSPCFHAPPCAGKITQDQVEDYAARKKMVRGGLGRCVDCNAHAYWQSVLLRKESASRAQGCNHNCRTCKQSFAHESAPVSCSCSPLKRRSGGSGPCSITSREKSLGKLTWPASGLSLDCCI